MSTTSEQQVVSSRILEIVSLEARMIATTKVSIRHINSKKIRGMKKANDDRHHNISNGCNLLDDINVNCGFKLQRAAAKNIEHGDWELMRVKSLLQPLIQNLKPTVGGLDGAAAAFPAISPLPSIHVGFDSSVTASVGTAFELYLSASTQNVHTLRGSKKRPQPKSKKRCNLLLNDGKSISKNMILKGGERRGGGLAANSSLLLSQSECGESLTLPRTQILPLPHLRPYSAMNDELVEENLGFSTNSCQKFDDRNTETSQLLGGMDLGVDGSQSQTLTSLPTCRKLSLSFSLGGANITRTPKEKLRGKKLTRAMMQVPRKVDSMMILNLVPISSHYLPPVYPYTKPSYSPGDFRRQMVKSVRERDFFVDGIKGERSVFIESHRIVRNWDETEGCQIDEKPGECIDRCNLLMSVTESQSINGGVHKITAPNRYAENIPVSCSNSLYGSVYSTSGHRRICGHEYDCRSLKQEGQTHILGVQIRRGPRSEVRAMNAYNRDDGIPHLDLICRKDDHSPLRDSRDDEKRLRLEEGEREEAEVAVDVEDSSRIILSAGVLENMKPVRRRSIINVDFYPDFDIDIDSDIDIDVDLDPLTSFEIGSDIGYT